MVYKTTFSYTINKRKDNTWNEIVSFERPIIDENVLDEGLDFGKLIFAFIPLEKALQPSDLIRITVTATYEDGNKSVEEFYRLCTNVSLNQRTFA